MQNIVNSDLDDSVFCLSRDDNEQAKGSGKCAFIFFWSVPQ